jgi:redox-sensing transcriptional repressor
VPAGVDVRKVDLSIELQILAFHAQRKAVVGVGASGRAARNGGMLTARAVGK